MVVIPVHMQFPVMHALGEGCCAKNNPVIIAVAGGSLVVIRQHYVSVSRGGVEGEPRHCGRRKGKAGLWQNGLRSSVVCFTSIRRMRFCLPKDPTALSGYKDNLSSLPWAATQDCFVPVPRCFSAQKFLILSVLAPLNLSC